MNSSTQHTTPSTTQSSTLPKAKPPAESMMDLLEEILYKRPGEVEEESREKLPRLILLDGFNLMHHFNFLDDRNPASSDESMSPIILLPVLLSWAQKGFPVRVVLRKMPDEKKATHMHILKELDTMGLVLYNPYDDVENDDLLMLKLAKDHGAIIVSRDQFRNHRGYEGIVDKYLVEYGHIPKSFPATFLEKALHYKAKIEYWESEDFFYAFEQDEDFELVKNSGTEFGETSFPHIERLQLLQLFYYNFLRYAYNLGLSSQTFFLKRDDVFPMKWIEFKARFNEYLLKKEKESKMNDPEIQERNEVIGCASDEIF